MEQSCPDSLYFNPEAQACDYPGAVPECKEGTRPPTGTTTTTTTTETPTTEEPTTKEPEEPTTEEPEEPTTEEPEEPTTEKPEEPTTEEPEEPTTEEPSTNATTTTETPVIPGVCPSDGYVRVPHECMCLKTHEKPHIMHFNICVIL